MGIDPIAQEELGLLQKISRFAALCIRNISLNNEASEPEEQVALALYSFVSEHKNILEQLTALGPTMASTGSLYGDLGTALHRQQVIVTRFQEVLNAQLLIARVRPAPDWIGQGEAMRSCLQVYPLPCEG